MSSHVFLQVGGVRKLPRAGLALEARVVLSLHVLLQLAFLLELEATLPTAQQLQLVLLLVLRDVEQHGLGSGVSLPTLRTGTLVHLVDLLQMSVESLHEGCAGVAETAFPRLVVAVIFVHVVHQPSEPPALFLTQLANTELLVVLGNLFLGAVTQFSLLFQTFLWNDFLWPPSLPFDWNVFTLDI